jgi:hypothetical protein
LIWDVSTNCGQSPMTSRWWFRNCTEFLQLVIGYELLIGGPVPVILLTEPTYADVRPLTVQTAECLCPEGEWTCRRETSSWDERHSTNSQPVQWLLSTRTSNELGTSWLLTQHWNEIYFSYGWSHGKRNMGSKDSESIHGSEGHEDSNFLLSSRQEVLLAFWSPRHLPSVLPLIASRLECPEGREMSPIPYTRCTQVICEWPHLTGYVVFLSSPIFPILATFLAFPEHSLRGNSIKKVN